MRTGASTSRSARTSARPADGVAQLDELDALFDTGPVGAAHWPDVGRHPNLTVTLEDARSGRIWQVTDGALDIVPQAAFIDTNVRFNVFNQTEELASTHFSFRSARDSSEASLSVRFDNAAARDIAAQSPVMAFLSVIDAPISGALRTTVTPDGGLEDLAGTLQIGAGGLSPVSGAPPAQFDGAKIYIDFDPTRQRIDFSGASLESEIGAFAAEGHVYLRRFPMRAGPNSLIGQIRYAAAPSSPAGFLRRARCDRQRHRRSQAAARSVPGRFRPDRPDAGYRGANRYEARPARARRPSRRARWLAHRARRGLRPAPPAEVLALWPVTVDSQDPRLGRRARARAAELVDGTSAFRKPTRHGTAQMSGYDFSDGDVRFLPHFPPITGGQGGSIVSLVRIRR